MRITKVGFIGLNTDRIDDAGAHYLDVLGMSRLGGGGRDGVHFGCPGSELSLSLFSDDNKGLASIGYEIATTKSLSEVAADLEGKGVAASVRSDYLPGIPEVVEMEDPDGNILFLYAGSQLQDIVETAPGIRPNKLGHVALFVEDAPRHAKFFSEILGFRWSDWLEDFFVFMRCNADHHSMNFMTDKRKRGLFHVAFELQDWAHICRSCDELGARDIPLLWGPGRHGMGHNIFTYHRDPDGNIVELFCDLDRMSDETLGYFDPRPYHEDFPQRPKVWPRSSRAANSWGVMAPPEFHE